MNILLIPERKVAASPVALGNRGLFGLALLFLGVLPGLSLYAGYNLGGAGENRPELIAQAWEDEMASQRATLEEARRVAEANLDALTLRMGQMQAHMIRLDALGQRLTEMAGLEDGEFDFSTSPALGGPNEGVESSSIAVPDFLAQLTELTAQMDDRDSQMRVLESMLMSRNLSSEVSPAGRPIIKGWLSSRYGMRTDPFTGRQSHHKGVDLAGKEGTEVIATAAGVVTWSGKRYGYGNLVEITHGNGYVTRYGHNKEHVVQVGQRVEKGQVIALMGNTGRSTGPHVHFEVWHNGKTVDPMSYIQASR